jgi:hypothetical protein
MSLLSPMSWMTLFFARFSAKSAAKSIKLKSYINLEFSMMKDFKIFMISDFDIQFSVFRPTTPSVSLQCLGSWSAF